jgi:hypothetical protein
MAFTTCLTAGTGAADGTALDFSGGRLPIVFQVGGAALTASDTITIQTQNLAANWVPIGTLTATSQRLVVQPPGIFRASRTGIIATSSGAEYDVAPIS